MDALEALMTRTSAKRLIDPAPDKTTVDTILRAAGRAADHGRRKPWRFIVIDHEKRSAFGQVLADALKRRNPTADERSLQAEAGKPLRAPLIIAVVAHLPEGDKILDSEKLLSTGAAAQNMMVAAHALGVGAMWKTGDGAYDPYVKEKLGLAESDAIIGFIYLGTPAGDNPKVPEFDYSLVQTWSP